MTIGDPSVTTMTHVQAHRLLHQAHDAFGFVRALKSQAGIANTRLIVEPGTYALGQTVILDGLQNVDISGAGWPTVSGFDLLLRDCANVSVSGLAFAGCGLRLQRVTGARVVDNRFSACPGSAVQIDGCTGVWVERNHIEGAQANQVIGNGAIQAIGSSLNYNLWIRDNQILDTGKVGIGLDNGSRVWIMDNLISGTANGEGIAVTGTDIKVTGNHIDRGNGLAAGILFWSYNPTDRRIQIVNNTCADHKQGIALVWGYDGCTLRDVLVTGNVCHDNARWGIQSYWNEWPTMIDYHYSNVRVFGNDLTGNPLGETEFYAPLANEEGAQLS